MIAIFFLQDGYDQGKHQFLNTFRFDFTNQVNACAVPFGLEVVPIDRFDSIGHILHGIFLSRLEFNRFIASANETINGKILIQRVLDDLLSPLPATPKISAFEITLEIETGNLIHKSFKDVEELFDFIQNNAQNPAKIRELISPKKRIRKIGEQSAFYTELNDDDEW